MLNSCLQPRKVRRREHARSCPEALRPQVREGSFGGIGPREPSNCNCHSEEIGKWYEKEEKFNEPAQLGTLQSPPLLAALLGSSNPPDSLAPKWMRKSPNPHACIFVTSCSVATPNRNDTYDVVHKQSGNTMDTTRFNPPDPCARRRRERNRNQCPSEKSELYTKRMVRLSQPGRSTHSALVAAKRS